MDVNQVAKTSTSSSSTSKTDSSRSSSNGGDSFQDNLDNKLRSSSGSETKTESTQSSNETRSEKTDSGNSQDSTNGNNSKGKSEEKKSTSTTTTSQTDKTAAEAIKQEAAMAKAFVVQSMLALAGITSTSIDQQVSAAETSATTAQTATNVQLNALLAGRQAAAKVAANNALQTQAAESNNTFSKVTIEFTKTQTANQEASAQTTAVTQVKTAEAEVDTTLKPEEILLQGGKSTITSEALINVNGKNQTVVLTDAVSALNEQTLKSNVNNQLVQGITDMQKTGTSTMRLQLYPDSLGRIEVRLVTNSSGTQVYMSAERPATARMLEASLDQLSSSLVSAGVNLGSLNVGQNAQQNFGFASSNPSTYIFVDNKDDLEAEAEAGLTISNAGTSGLDYQV